MKSGKTVDDILAASPWKAELARLRTAVLAAGLEETVKWGMPVYTAHGQNVAGLGGFKNHFGVWFFQGALLADKDGVLVNAQEGKTKAMRQMRMTSAKDINARRVTAYAKEAAKLADDGKAIPPERAKRLVVPPELKAALAADAAAKAAFDALTPGCKREYAEHVSEAKREETRLRRVEKVLPMIKAGGGLNDRYRPIRKN